MGFLFLSIRQPPRSTRTDTLSLHDALPICHFRPPCMNPASCPRMGVFCRAQPAKANRMSEADTISASAAPGANAHAAGSLPNGGLEGIGRAHVRTPVTNAQLICRHQVEQQDEDTRTTHAERTTVSNT